MIGMLERLRDMKPQYEARSNTKYHEEDIYITQFGNTCQAFVEETMEPYARLSANVPTSPPEGYFWLKAWSENEEFVKHLVAENVIEVLDQPLQITQWVSVRPAKLIDTLSGKDNDGTPGAS